MLVLKRNGQMVAFDKGKIMVALARANKDVVEEKQLSGNSISDVVSRVKKHCMESKTISSEDIHGFVVEELNRIGATDVARAYVQFFFEES